MWHASGLSFLVSGGLCNAALVSRCMCVSACVRITALGSRGAFSKHGTNSQARPTISKQGNFPVEVLKSAGL